ncbi:MAG: CHASE2 domain-containing protein, partial [Geobacter sp.]
WMDNLFSLRNLLFGKAHIDKLSKVNDSPIVIISIPSLQEHKKKSIKKEEQNQGIIRAVEILTNCNVKVIAFNFLPSFSHADEKTIHDFLAKKKSYSLVLPFIFIRMGNSLSLIGFPSTSLSKVSGATGLLEISSNAKMRWISMVEVVGGKEYRHFILGILSRFYGLKDDEVSIKKTLLGKEIKLGKNKVFNLHKGSRFYIDYFTSSSTEGIMQPSTGCVTVYTLDQVLKKEVGQAELDGKIVLLGSVDPIERCFQLTPLGFISDSEIYAQALYSILKGPQLVVLPNLTFHILIILLGCGCFLLFTRIQIGGNPLKGNPWVFLILIVIYLLIDVLLFCVMSVYLDIIPFILLLTGVYFLSIYTTSEEQQAELDSHLDKFKTIIETALLGSESVEWGNSILTLVCNPLKVDRGVLILIRDDKIGPDAREIYCYPPVEDARSHVRDEEIEAMLKVKKPLLGPSSLVVPLKKGNDRFGLLKLQKRSFTTKEVQIMMALSHLTFISLYNIRLMEKIKKSERLQMEAELAGQIQKAFLVEQAPEFRGVSIACRCMPASEAGGDYFDFITSQEGLIGIAVADVTGHGMGAAIITGLLRSGLRAQSALSSSPAEVVTSINNVLYNDFVSFGKMASLHYATYSVVDKTLTFTNAGQSPPLLIRREEPQARVLKGKGPILGFRQNIKYKEFRTKIYPG